MTADLAGYAAAAAAGTLTDAQADEWLLQVTSQRTVPGCPHLPPCPSADAVDHDAAHVVWHDYGIGASRLCNGILAWDDTGELVPDPAEPCGCHIEAPHRGPAPHNTKGQ